MNVRKSVLSLTRLFALITAVGFPSAVGRTSAIPQAAGQSTIAKSIGTIKSINGNALTLTPTSGPKVAVAVQPNARILRLQPGSTDVKTATPLALQDLQVGDTIRARGPGSDDGKSIQALEIIVITRSAVAAVSDQIRQDWQKRGIGGLVSAVDASTGAVTISIPSLVGDRKLVTVHISSSTVIRRYAPDSASFEAAQPSTLQAIHVNDQLRARGDRSPDGNDFTAAEIVTGTFPYVEGTVKSVDASANTITVQDVLSKKSVLLKVTSDSQLHQIPADMAQRMAFILKRAKQGGAVDASASASPRSNPPGGQTGAATGGQSGVSGGAGAMRPGGSGLQRMLDSAPTVKLAELHKGDALAILATEGMLTSGGTVVKLYSGVEPILEAAPNAMTLAPWSLGGAPNGDTGNQ